MSCPKIQIMVMLLFCLFKASCKSFEQEQNLAAMDTMKPWAFSGYLADSPQRKVWLVIRGDRIHSIQYVEPDLPFIDTEGFIFPGLIDLLGPIADPQLLTYFQDSENLKQDEICALLRWNELKALTAGVTSLPARHEVWAACLESFGSRNLDLASDQKNRTPLLSLGDLMPPQSWAVFRESFAGPVRSKKQSYAMAFEVFSENQGIKQWIEDFQNLPQDLENGLKLMLGPLNIPSWAAQLDQIERIDAQDDELYNILTSRVGLSDSRVGGVVLEMQQWLSEYADLTPDQRADEAVALAFLVKPAVFLFPDAVKNYLRTVELSIRLKLHRNLELDKNTVGLLALVSETAGELPGRQFRILADLQIEPQGLILQNTLGLNHRELSTAAKNGMHLIWTPQSDLNHYGQTLDLKAARKENVNIVLGSDGHQPKHLLDQLKVARAYFDRNTRDQVSNQELVNMVTTHAAKALRKEDQIAKVAEGFLADLLIIDRCTDDPYQCLVQSDQQNIKLVVVGGEGVFGDHSIISEGQGLWQRPGAYEVLPSRRGAKCLRRDKALWLGAEISSYDRDLSLDSSRPSLRNFSALENIVKGIDANNLIFTCDDETYLQEFKGY